MAAAGFVNPFGQTSLKGEGSAPYRLSTAAGREGLEALTTISWKQMPPFEGQRVLWYRVPAPEYVAAARSVCREPVPLPLARY